MIDKIIGATYIFMTFLNVVIIRNLAAAKMLQKK